MTNPTGDALKASAAQVRPLDLPNLLKHAFDCGQGSMTSRSMWVDYDPTGNPAYQRILSALSSVEQAPQPVPTEVAWKDGFIVGQAQPGMNAHWIWMQRRDALHPTPTEAPPVESQAAEMARLPQDVQDSLSDSRYLAGVTAGWNAAHDDDSNAALAKIRASFEGYLKPLRDWQKAGRPAPSETEITRLRNLMKPLIGLLTGLVAESRREIGWGEEDSFRMGEWFDDEDLAAIEAARAALAAEGSAE